MAEITLSAVRHSFGGPALVDGVDLSVEAGERIALVGRNGCGKSTLLAILAGSVEPDEGQRTVRPGLVIGALPQAVPDGLTGTVRSHLEAALAEHDVPEWDVVKRIDRATRELRLDPDAPLASLSAGAQRRVLWAAASIVEPDVLLLDEPTNHLDVEAILALEERLLRPGTTLVCVTHDRAFLRRVATRILDLDRGRLASHACDYTTYVQRKSDELELEAERNAQLDKELAREEAWLRRGIQARRTRNTGRVRALLDRRAERRARREAPGRVQAGLTRAERSGDLVLEAHGLTVELGGRRVLDDVDLEVRRGDRVGIVGPNGAGKTTLVRALLGELELAGGSVRRGTRLAIGRFEQLQGQLDETKTVVENICDQAETIVVGGRSRHALGYCQDFLFPPDVARGPLARLSGGERNRVQLARVLAHPCNLLVLDEPTNDLDVETLELLEELLGDFDGTLLLVSHDREFLDNLVTQTWSIEPGGRVVETVGGWVDRERQRSRAEPAPRRTRTAKPKSAEPAARKLTYPEQHELAGLPAAIEAIEARKAALEERLSDPELYRGPGADIARTTAELAAVDDELGAAYARWEELESLASDGQRTSSARPDNTTA